METRGRHFKLNYRRHSRKFEEGKEGRVFLRIKTKKIR